MADLSSIQTDPNYVNANAATKQAIFDKFSATDTNFTSANLDTQNAIRERFGLVAPAAPSEIPAPRAPGAGAAFGRGLASVADLAAGVVPGAISSLGYAGARAVGQNPAQAQQFAGQISAPFEQPVGKLFGVTGTPEYQQEPTRKFVNALGTTIVQPGAKQIASYTGLPESDVVNMLGTASVALPKVLSSQPVKKAAAAVGNAAKNTTAQLVGTLSGKSGDAYKIAYESGKAGDRAFIENLRGKVPPDEILGEIKQGLSKIQSANSAAYSTAKTGWAADTTPLNIDAVTAAYDKVQSSLQQRGKSLIGDAEQRIVKEIGDVLDQWKADPAARTALDFDALKRRIDAVYPESPKHSNAQRAVTEVRNAVKNEITNQVPAYADAMKAYDQQLTLIRDISKALGTGDKVAKETAINKAIGVLKNKPASEYTRNLVNELEQQGGVSVLPSLAGQELGQFVPSSGLGRSIAGLGAGAAYLMHNPVLAAAAPFTSPRLMGEAAYAAGRVAAAKGNVTNALSNLTPQQLNAVNILATQAAANRQNQLSK
jgi:hypothetical protein